MNTLANTLTPSTQCRAFDLPHALISPNRPFQMRRAPVPEDVQIPFEQSIATEGVLQPITVRPAGGLYEIVFGHRRAEASAKARHETIPAIVWNGEDREAYARAVAENLARAPLGPVDQWRAMQDLQRLGWTVTGAAMAIGIGERLARRLSKLGHMHPDILAAIERHGMPLHHWIATIAQAPEAMQAAAIAHKESWQGSGKDREPDWHRIAQRCSRQRIPATRAIFDRNLAGVEFEEDLFAEPGSDEQLTTADIAGFMEAQRAALKAKAEKARGKLQLADWDARNGRPELPKGWQLYYGAAKDRPSGAVQFGGVTPDGYRIGEVSYAWAFPPPPKEPAKRKGAKGEGTATTWPGASMPVGAAASEGGAGEGTEEGDDAPPATIPARPGRGPVTAKGLALIAQQKTVALRCALRDRPPALADLVACFVLLLEARNVSVRGIGYGRYLDLVAQLVAQDGQPLRPEEDALRRIGAEALARTLSCGEPENSIHTNSGAAAEWIGARVDAGAALPRLDTLEILETVTGDALRAIAVALGDAGKGTTKALRERLAGNAPELRPPGAEFRAPGPDPDDVRYAAEVARLDQEELEDDSDGEGEEDDE